ncbi:hypothetical protein NQD34_008976 [Periophthalmus magnuspinnatus]|nr:hypothetical protein NQD34_008976 [Periophthalmus magnuspinnatus]
MSLSDQLWSPTSVQVTALQARGLRIKGKNGTNDAYAVMHLGKEKYQTSVAEKTVAPVWKEEASFDMPSAHQGGTERGTLRVLVLHRALVGPDKLLGQAVINLVQLSEDKNRDKTQWFKLVDKSGKPDKDRGEVLVDIQFTRNNMTASMFDISAAGKSRSRLSKFKDKVRGKKKEEAPSETSSNVVPAFSQVVTDSEGEGGSDGEGAAAGTEPKKKNKVKSLFSHKTNLQKSLSQSMSVLPGKNSSLSGSMSSGLNVNTSEGKKKFKFLSHKRTGSSEKKDQKLVAEQSNLCINGSHVYCEEPAPRTSRASSNFSLASSGMGSMEDVPDNNSPPSVGSRHSVHHSSPWTEEEEEETIEENTQEVTEEMFRRQELEKLAEDESRIEEEEQRREEKERRNREEEERIRMDEEKRRQDEWIEKERFQKEVDKNLEIMRVKEERSKQEEEEEQRKREEGEREQIREEEERIRLEEEQKRCEEEEKKRQTEEEKRRQGEESGAIEKKREEERLEELRKLKEEKARKEILKEEERERREELERMEEVLRMEKEREEQQIEEARKLEEERKRHEEERIRFEREKERQREEKERLMEAKRMQHLQEEQERIRQEEERMRMLEKEKVEEMRRERMEEEEQRVRKEQEYERLRAQQKKQEEEEEKRREEEKLEKEKLAEEKRRREEEEERRRREEEKLEKEKLAEEKRRREEEEERRRREEEKLEKEKLAEEKRRREEEEERRRREEEKLEKEKLAEEKRREEEEERRRREEEKLEKEKFAEEERRRREEEKLEKEKLAEEKRRREEEEEKLEKEKIAEEERRQEEKRRKEQEEKQRKEEETHKKERLAEEERRQMREEEERQMEEERRREENRRREEEERQMEEERREENRRREEEKLEKERLAEEEWKRKEEMRRKEHEERHRKEDEKWREEETQEEERLAEEERTQEEKRRQEEERMEETQRHFKITLDAQNRTEVTSANPFDQSDKHKGDVPEQDVTITSARQRCKFPAERNACLFDEKDDSTTQREKRQAPKPPRMNSSETQWAAQHEAHVSKPSRDKDIKTASILPQCAVQKINPVIGFSSQINYSKQPARSSERKPAPQRPALIDEISLSKGSQGPMQKSRQGSAVTSLNPFEGDEEVDDTTSTKAVSAIWPLPGQLSVEMDTVSQIKTKSSKTAHAPAPPTKNVHTLCTDTGHKVTVSDIEEEKDCVLVQKTLNEEAVQEESGKKDAPPVPSRRLQSVTPLNPVHQVPVSAIQEQKDKKSSGEIVNNQGKENVKDTGPYALLTQEELISLVHKQESQLLEKSKKISELEQYIDNLLVRVIEEAPNILMTMAPLK